jgi:hypothetical protein
LSRARGQEFEDDRSVNGDIAWSGRCTLSSTERQASQPQSKGVGTASCGVRAHPNQAGSTARLAGARPRTAGPGCSAARRAASRLAPDGGHPSRARRHHPRPWRTWHRRRRRLAPCRSARQGDQGCAFIAGPEHRSQAGCAAFMGAAHSRGRGSRVCFLHPARERTRLTNWPTLRSRRFASIAPRQPDRHPGHPPRPMPGR